MPSNVQAALAESNLPMLNPSSIVAGGGSDKNRKGTEAGPEDLSFYRSLNYDATAEDMEVLPTHITKYVIRITFRCFKT